LLNSEQVEAIFVCHQVHGDTQVTESPGSTDSVQIRLARFRKIKVDDDVHGLNVDTSREQIRGDQVSARSGSEIVEDFVPVALLHFRVDVKARIAKLGNFPREQFNSVHRVAKNHRLIDL
jgi:hypothetical protein